MDPTIEPATGSAAWSEIVTGPFDEEKVREAAGRARRHLGGRANLAFLFISCDLEDSLPELIQHASSEYGIFGVTTQVSSSYIILFVTFAAFLQVSRVGDYINDLCNALFGWARGGPAKAAVASGMMFGTISGSAVANVVASGMVTIPMMRKVGYDRSTAAAIEATSSTGGQITPPVLGAGAFLMAEITGIPELALSALFFATLSQGGLAINAMVPKQIVEVLQGLVILAVAASVPEVRALVRRAAGGRRAEGAS